MNSLRWVCHTDVILLLLNNSGKDESLTSNSVWSVIFEVCILLFLAGLIYYNT